MPFREEVNYIAVHDEIHEHPKIEPLSDAAFRALHALWCYCSRQENDGIFTEQVWLRRSTPKVRAELLDSGMVERFSDGRYEAHDYRGSPRGRSPLPRWLRKAVIERDGMLCRLCKRPVLAASDLHVDHIKPVAHGGSDQLDNLQVAHSWCNLRKGARV